ncbi:MAG: hypothetical protein ACK44H_08075 [Candidatus Kryptonium sp.]
MRGIFLAFISFFILSQFLYSQEVLLRFQPEKGKNFVYYLSSEGVLTQSAMGMEQVVNSKTETKFSYFIQDVSPEGNIEMIISVDTIKTGVRAQTPPLDTSFVVPIHLKLKQVLDKYGKGISFEVVEMKDSKLLGMSGRGIDKRSYSHTVVFPERKISKGDTWDFSYIDTTSNESGQTVVKARGRYTFDGVEKINDIECARLILSSNFAISGQGVIQGMNYGLEGEGKNIGKIWVDLKSGLLVRSETVSEIETAMGISGQVEMTIPMSQKITTIVSLAK